MSDLTRRGFTASVISAFALRGQASEENLAALSLAQASARIRARTVTATELTQACLARIATFNPKLNRYITVMRDRALAQARQLDAEQRRAQRRSPLHRLPIAPT